MVNDSYFIVELSFSLATSFPNFSKKKFSSNFTFHQHHIILIPQFSFSTAASTCRKEQVREYYTENDCRSRQPLKYAKCVGGCGNQCCAAKVVRRRKVRMVCSNNAKYVKNLDIVRKCGCTKKCY